MSTTLAEEKRVLAQVRLLEKFGEKVLTEAGDLSENILDVIDTAISSESPVISLLGVSMLADLLAGGAYTTPVQSQPYYSAQLTGPEPAPVGGKLWRLPDGNVVRTPDGAKAEQEEAIINANVPTRFPRLLSAQMKFLVKEYISLMFFTSLAKDIVVPTISGLVGPQGLRTLVKGSKIRNGRGTQQTLPVAVRPSEE